MVHCYVTGYFSVFEGLIFKLGNRTKRNIVEGVNRMLLLAVAVIDLNERNPVFCYRSFC